MQQDHDLFTKKLSHFVALSAAELAILEEFQTSAIHVKRGKELVREGGAGQIVYIIQAGWGCSFKLLPDGGRQIVTFPIPGDCVGLRSMLLRTSDHNFAALTDAIVTPVEAPRMKHLFKESPYLGAAILWATSRDEAMIVEHLVSIGRRNAVERTAHLFLELYDRLRMVGLASNNEFECPLNQHFLADALGLSEIHVNRVLRQLRERGLLTFRERNVTIHNKIELKALAGYESPEEGDILITDRTPRDG